MSQQATNPPAVFDYSGRQVRAITIDGDPWFVAVDVCKILDHSNHRMAVAGLDADEKGVSTTDTPGGPQSTIIVSEAGLYALVMRSRRPEAKAFSRWVRHEVLPSIRRTGSYGAPQAAIPQTYADALQLAADQARMIDRQASEIETAQAKVAELEPRTAATATATRAYSTADVPVSGWRATPGR